MIGCLIQGWRVYNPVQARSRSQNVFFVSIWVQNQNSAVGHSQPGRWLLPNPERACRIHTEERASINMLSYICVCIYLPEDMSEARKYIYIFMYSYVHKCIYRTRCISKICLFVFVYIYNIDAFRYSYALMLEIVHMIFDFNSSGHMYIFVYMNNLYVYMNVYIIDHLYIYKNTWRVYGFFHRVLEWWSSSNGYDENQVLESTVVRSLKTTKTLRIQYIYCFREFEWSYESRTRNTYIYLQ